MPSIRTAKGVSEERVRVTVLPGLSMLCWAQAFGLERAKVWQSTSMSFLLETLRDEDTQKVYLRMWQFRDAWEMRPTWHGDRGPIELDVLVKKLRPLMSVAPAKEESSEPVTHSA